MPYVYTDEVRHDILRMIPPDGKVVGSFGCGYGTTECELVKAGRIVHGADIAPEAIERARTRLSSATLIPPGRFDVFAEASLDGLILADVIEHIPRAWEALAALSRSVRPGGWVAISVPNMRSVGVLGTFVLGGEWPERPMGIFDETHLQVMTRRRLQRWCVSAGLREESWFDLYDPNGPRRQRWSRLGDLLTFKVFHEWFMYELQVLCRKK